MADIAASFVVVLAEASEIPAPQIAEAISAYKKIPFQDAVHDVRTAWGFLDHNLTHAEADGFAAALESKGIRCRVLAVEALAPLPPIESVKALTMAPSEISFTAPSGEVSAIAYAQITVIAAAGLPIRAVTKEKITEGRTNTQKLVNVGLLLAGIPISIGKKKRVIEKSTVKEDILFYLDVVVAEPARRFRIDAQSLNYSFLQERMLHNTLQNFKTLLSALVQLAPAARINRGTRFLVKNQILTQMGYETFTELERETLWLTSI